MIKLLQNNIPKYLPGRHEKDSYTVAAHLRAAGLMETQHFFSKGHST